MAECAWCTVPVDRDGYTCSPECYTSFLVALAGGGVLNHGERVPFDLRSQPWYLPYLGEKVEQD